MEDAMFRPALIALAAIVIAAPVVAERPKSEPMRKSPWHSLAVFKLDPWQLAFVGNDTQVNHCALSRSSVGSDPQPGEPKLTIMSDGRWTILEIRAAEFRSSDRKAIPLTLATAAGLEVQPHAVTGGADIVHVAIPANVKLVDNLSRSSHLDIRTEDVTVRVPLNGLQQMMAPLARCMKNIGKPAEKFSPADVAELVDRS